MKRYRVEERFDDDEVFVIDVYEDIEEAADVAIKAVKETGHTVYIEVVNVEE